MNPPRNALTLFAAHLSELSRRTEGDAALQQFAEAGLDLEGAGDLFALVRQCGIGGGVIRSVRRAEVVVVLAPLAPRDEVAAMVVLAVLRPELTVMSRQLARTDFDLEEAAAEMAAIGWKAVTDPSQGEHRDRGRSGCERSTPGPRALLNEIWNETRRSVSKRRGGTVEVVALTPEIDAPVSAVDPTERWPGLLAAAVAAGVLTPRQLVVIAQSRMEGRPLTEVAKSLGRPYNAIRMERGRAERALRNFALSYYSSGPR